MAPDGREGTAVGRGVGVAAAAGAAGREIVLGPVAGAAGRLTGAAGAEVGMAGIVDTGAAGAVAGAAAGIRIEGPPLGFGGRLIRTVCFFWVASVALGGSDDEGELGTGLMSDI